MDDERETPCVAPAVPHGLTAGLSGYHWARSSVGEAGAAVYRLSGKPGAPDLFVKHGTGAVADDLIDELVRMRWLVQHIPVPIVTHLSATPGETWLVMTAVPGETAFQVLEARPESRPAVVDALVDFLRLLHAIPADECPFNSDHLYRLSLARKRIDAGLVEEEDFDPVREGWAAEQVWQAMHRILPFAPDPVVTHGDFSLDNILLVEGRVIGCIDVGRAGIADRYQDLAILWNCLGEFDGDLQARLIARYGVSNLDQDKLAFHLMLDELF